MPLDQLIEPDDVSLDDVLPTMHRLAAGELPGKVMVRPVGTAGMSARREVPRRGSTTSRSRWTRRCSTTQGRAEILDFYGDVFGWTEGDNTGEPATR